jgi:CTD nuclear envelope phosphatase 1
MRPCLGLIARLLELPPGCRDIDGVCRTMNSLNLLSSRVIGQPSPLAEKISRRKSAGDVYAYKEPAPEPPKRALSYYARLQSFGEDGRGAAPVARPFDGRDEADDGRTPPPAVEEPQEAPQPSEPTADVKPQRSGLQMIAKRIVEALAESLRWVLAKLAAPGMLMISCLYDDDGKLSPLLPLRGSALPKSGTRSTAHALGLSRPADQAPEKRATRAKAGKRGGDAATSEDEADAKTKKPSRSPRRREGSASTDETSATRRSIRIRLNNEENARRKKAAKTDSSPPADCSPVEAALAAELKSPTWPASSLRMTKYPHAPLPPRPLIPRRQPSYSAGVDGAPGHLGQKTLVIDLDETLIHSLAKGGRMSSGHMVEVKLQSAYNGLSLGPQHPILYYVHKRPHCDHFLRKVSGWYNLVVFTASVQEYADPVIDWLEQERKYFSARYYRQHCTFRNGAYIKDLSSVEPNLSKVMILDNSPLSYIFHEGRRNPQ